MGRATFSARLMIGTIIEVLWGVYYGVPQMVAAYGMGAGEGLENDCLYVLVCQQAKNFVIETRIYAFVEVYLDGNVVDRHSFECRA